MFELRRFRKAIDRYEVLIYYYPEKAKENREIFEKDVRDLLDFLESYMDDETENLKIFCDASVEIFCSEDTGVFNEIKNFIRQKIVNYQLDQIVRRLEKAGIDEQRLKGILHRFEQYKYLLS